MSPAFVLAWAGLSIVVILLGKLADSNIVFGFGVVMLLMTALFM